ncbi:restriction endonuclease subunit S [Actinophytocola sp.]|uniref:restriction endonuclease subunit S n=1 Tax=Actinophytocola sp. TaxID=1872138 RepID=UPI00389AE9E1
MDSLIGVVPNYWAEQRLDSVCEILSGAHMELVTRTSADVPVVTPHELSNNKIADDCALGTSRKAAGRLSRYRLKPDDIVCSRRGDLGRRGLTGGNQLGWLISSACLRLRVRKMISAPYLVYYLGHTAVRRWIAGSTGGAVLPSLSTVMLGALPVVVPPMAVQLSIADTLRALDEKIVIYERISRTTAALREALLPQLLSEANPASSTYDIR